MEIFSDRHLETEDILTKIAEAFKIGKTIAKRKHQKYVAFLL